MPLTDPFCARCGDTGEIKTWCGRAGMGGRTGPCPNCQPSHIVKPFVTALAQESFPQQNRGTP